MGKKSKEQKRWVVLFVHSFTLEKQETTKLNVRHKVMVQRFLLQTKTQWDPVDTNFLLLYMQYGFYFDSIV